MEVVGVLLQAAEVVATLTAVGAEQLRVEREWRLKSSKTAAAAAPTAKENGKLTASG